MSDATRSLADETDLAQFIRDRGPHCLIVARHGETEWNAEGRLQGQQDIPLNGRGRTQAQAVARFLRTIPLGQVHSSTLQRCRETAGPIAEANIGRPDVVSSDLLKGDRLRRSRGRVDAATVHCRVDSALSGILQGRDSLPRAQWREPTRRCDPRAAILRRPMQALERSGDPPDRRTQEHEQDDPEVPSRAVVRGGTSGRAGTPAAVPLLRRTEGAVVLPGSRPLVPASHGDMSPRSTAAMRRSRAQRRTVLPTSSRWRTPSDLRPRPRW